MSSLNVATPHKKPRKDKQRQPPPRKTDRRQIPTETRAFLVGALFASAGGGVTKHSLATTTKIRKGTIQRIEARAQQRAQEADLPLWDPYNFQDELRGKEQLLDAEDKRKIATAVTSGRTVRYSSPGDIKSMLNDLGITDLSISFSTIESTLYQQGYARRKGGWKFLCTWENQQARYDWALHHNPDPNPELPHIPPFDWHTVVFTDETPGKVGIVRGFFRCWANIEEAYHPDVVRTRHTKYSEIQFWACFAYNNKGPCHVYFPESSDAKEAAQTDLASRNAARQQRYHQRRQAASTARQALAELGEPVLNRAGHQRPFDQLAKRPNEKPLVRGDRQRGGIDGYRHEQEVLIPKLLPFLEALKQQGRVVYLLEDGAPAHTSRFDTEFMEKAEVNKMIWPGNSPDVNAEEHAWPWMRAQLGKHWPKSKTREECAEQWRQQWSELDLNTMNSWIDRIPHKIRKIIAQRGRNNFHG